VLGLIRVNFLDCVAIENYNRAYIGAFASTKLCDTCSLVVMVVCQLLLLSEEFWM